MINHLEINDFKGINLTTDLKRVNIIVAEGEIDKTAILEAIFLPTLALSNYTDWYVINYTRHVLASRGDMLSAFMSFTDSEIKTDDDETYVTWDSSSTLEIDANNGSEIDVTIDDFENKFYIEIDDPREQKYTPTYISTSFYMPPVPEIIFSEAVLRKKDIINGDWHILHVRNQDFRLHYKDNPVYAINKGILKKELIRLALTFSDVLLIDEIEDSLHPTLLNETLNMIKEAKDIQVIMTTFSSKVVKAFYGVSDAQVIHVTDKGYKVYEMSNESSLNSSENNL